MTDESSRKLRPKDYEIYDQRSAACFLPTKSCKNCDDLIVPATREGAAFQVFM